MKKFFLRCVFGVLQHWAADVKYIIISGQMPLILFLFQVLSGGRNTLKRSSKYKTEIYFLLLSVNLIFFYFFNPPPRITAWPSQLRHMKIFCINISMFLRQFCCLKLFLPFHSGRFSTCAKILCIRKMQTKMYYIRNLTRWRTSNRQEHPGNLLE